MKQFSVHIFDFCLSDRDFRLDEGSVFLSPEIKTIDVTGKTGIGVRFERFAGHQILFVSAVIHG
jgi:hypothetical protein